MWKFLEPKIELARGVAAFRPTIFLTHGRVIAFLDRIQPLLRNTDRPIAEICFAVGLKSLGSFTTSFGRAYGATPAAYRAAHPPASLQALVPACVLRAYSRAVLEKTARPSGRTVAAVQSMSKEGAR